MKRLLALLLALLLPGCAFAETWGMSVAVEVNELAFTANAKHGLQAVPQFAGVDLNALTAAVAKVLNGLTIQASVQDDAVAAKVSLAQGTLLDMNVYTSDDVVYITSPMLIGNALWVTLADENETESVLNETDWTSVSASATEAVSAWLEGIEYTIMQGAFDGDAYSGGTKCITWMLSDRDIAALVSALVTDDVREIIADLLHSMTEVEECDLLTQLDKLNSKVADEDAYKYILRVVTNDADTFVGASLTVLQKGTQVATVSLGYNGNEIRLVVGIGLHEQNYWWNLDVIRSQQENVTYLSGSSREWAADKSASYSYVSATNAPIANHVMKCTVTKSGERILWDGSISVAEDKHSIISVSGCYYLERGSLESSVHLGGTGAGAPMTLKFVAAPVESIPPMDSELMLCSMSAAEDAARNEELTQKFVAAFMARLIKLLPMDLIMTINQFTLPQ